MFGITCLHITLTCIELHEFVYAQCADGVKETAYKYISEAEMRIGVFSIVCAVIFANPATFHVTVSFVPQA